MIAKPLYNYGCFLFNFIQEPLSVGVVGAGEHKILPDHYSKPVAKLVKLVCFVVAAAPYTKHIYIGVGCSVQEFLIIAAGNRACKYGGWNPVCALSENGLAVYFKPEFFTIPSPGPRTGFVRRVIELYSSYPESFSCLVYNFVTI